MQDVHARLTDTAERAMFSAMMTLRMLVVAAITTGWLAALGASLAAEQAPQEATQEATQEETWFGNWQLNPARSTSRSDASPYKKVTSRIEPTGDGLTVVYDMVGTRGGVTHLEWTGRFDSRDYPVRGVDYVLTNAYRRIDDRSYAIVVKVDGTVAATAVVVVSPDGRTLTVSTAERDPRGQTVNTTAVYEKLTR
jgi:hypothetical protein